MSGTRRASRSTGLFGRSGESERRRSWAPGPVKVVVVGAGVLGVTFAGLQVADGAEPQKVLQAVDVQVSPDGAVSSISSTAIRQKADGSTEDDETTHDPSKVADKLPVRVLTSYRLGKSSGTDLSDIEGREGRVQIDVTVQNTTVRPRVLSYDSEGTSKKASALVGTPLTVVASANLGDADLSAVVPTDAEGQGDARGTNGVASEDSDGNSTVQWASMLAPPKLAPSATFSLVMDTKDFKVPTFDLSVQPGLTTDSSISGLIDSTFSSDTGTRALTADTIELLSSVGTVLTDASTVLNKVESQLDGSASELGTKTIGDLKDSSSNVTSALQGLSGDLDSLDSTVESSVNASSDAAIKQLDSSLTQVKKKVLGDADSYKPATPAPTGTGCVTTPPTSSRQTTVYAQLRDVQAQLGQLSKATAGCRDAVIQQLRATIGADSDTCPADPSKATALGSITCASTAIGVAAGDIVQLREDINKTFDASLLGQATLAFGDVRDTLNDARQRANLLAAGAIGGDFDELKEQFQQVKDALTEVDGKLDDISIRANDQVDLLEGDQGALRQLETVADLVCSNLGGSSDADRASRLLQGTDCNGFPGNEPDYDSSLQSKIEETRDAWVQTREDASTQVPGSVGSLVDSLLGQINDLLTQLDDLVEQGNAASLQDGVRELARRIEALYQPRPQDPIDGKPQPDLEPAYDTLVFAFKKFAQNQGDVQGSLDPVFQTAAQKLAQSQQDLGTRRSQVAASREKAAANIASLFNIFSGSLDETGQRIVENGDRAIAQQSGALDDEADAFESSLSGTVAKALRQVTSQVDAANSDLDSSERKLVGDLQAILVNIGTPQQNGSGLLGTIYTGARRTGASTTKIADANKLSQAFSRVRGTALDDLYLQQAQVAASLQAESDYPAFDLSLPAGSTSRTVFAVHLGKD